METRHTTPTVVGTGSTARRRALLAALVAVVAVGIPLLVGSARSSEEPSCRQSGAAQVCLVAEGAAYELDGSGFRPGSQLILTGDGGRPLVVRVDASGRLAGDGTQFGILGDRHPQRFLLTGTGADGAPVAMEVAVPGGDR